MPRAGDNMFLFVCGLHPTSAPGGPRGPKPNVERNGDNAVVEEPGSNEMTGGEESIPIDAVKLTTHVKSHADTERTPPAPQISEVGQSVRDAARLWELVSHIIHVHMRFERFLSRVSDARTMQLLLKET